MEHSYWNQGLDNFIEYFYISPYLFNIVLEFVTWAIRKQKEVRGIQFGKEEVKISPFADDMIVHLSDPKNSTKEPLNLKNNFIKVAGYKINSNKSVAFLYLKDKESEKKLGKDTLHNRHK